MPKKIFRSYKETQKWARKEGIVSVKDWHSKASIRPSDIPAAPNDVYKGEFKSWRDFLGKGNIAPQNKVFRSFLRAQEWAKKEGIVSVKDWHSKASIRPSDIPANPHCVYKEEFKSWGDFLGTGFVANQNRIFRSYEETQKWAILQKIKSSKDWQLKASIRPSDIPAYPNQFYKKEFKSWGDFLGTGLIAGQNKVFRSFSGAKKWARENGIKTQKDFQSSIRPDDIPFSVEKVYKGEFRGWADFLGSPRASGNRSRVEVILERELSFFLPICEKRQDKKVRITPTKLKNVDIYIPSLKLIIEYDGCRFHKNEKKDKLETRLLKKQGYQVIRIRENPLSLISQKMDLNVESRCSYIHLCQSVLKHLNILKIIPKNKQILLNDYLKRTSYLSDHSDLQAIKFETFCEWLKENKITSKANFNTMLKSKTNNYPEHFPRAPCNYFKRTNEWKGWPFALGKTKDELKSKKYAKILVIQKGIKKELYENLSIQDKQKWRLPEKMDHYENWDWTEVDRRIDVIKARKESRPLSKKRSP